MLRYCFNCNKKREVKVVGEYSWKGDVKVVGEYSWKGDKYPIFLCRWCRAANTRRKNMPTNGVSDKKQGSTQS